MYFNSQTIDDELFILLECVVYQFRRSLAMKLIDLHARQIESAGGIRRVPARSRALS